MRDREFAEKTAQLDQARETLRGKVPRSIDIDGQPLSGDYNTDMDLVIGKLETERKRASFIDAQNRTLITQLEQADRRSADAVAAAAELRASLARKDDATAAKDGELIAAEARIADAESRVNTMLADTSKAIDDSDQRRGQMLAEKLAIEDELEKLKSKVLNVEATIMADWDTERMEQSHLRERLNDIASDVSRLVYAVEGSEPDSDESLLERVQKFSDTDLSTTTRGPAPTSAGSAVSDRLAALRELQERG
jgi:hypothetical protein